MNAIGDGCSYMRLADRMESKPSRLGYLLARMEKDGQVREIGGIIFITELGRAALAQQEKAGAE